VFSKGRDFGAWLGLVPKQISTGDRSAEQRRMPRYRLGMVAGGHCHDAGRSLLRCEQRHPVGGAALFEGACHLQRVELKPNIRPGQAADRVAVDDWRSNHLAGNAPGSRYNLFMIDQLSVLSSIRASFFR
jgi:hypothetical protein